MPLNVLQLGPYPPPEGGVSRNMLAVRDEVLKRGGRCSIIATTRSSEVRAEADVYHPGSAVELLRLLSSLRFDILHLHVGGMVTPRVMTLCSAATFFGRSRSVLTLHSGGYPGTKEGKSATARSFRGSLFRRFSRIIAVNEQIADVFNRYGVPAERIKVILPYSLELPGESITVPKTLQDFASASEPFLLSVGGLEKDYDPLFQIAAMKPVLAAHPRAGLMIVGDGSMRAEVEAAAAASGYADRICIAGNVEHPVTLHLINQADLLLRTTLFDGDAISVREALHLGTPVVATDNGMRPGSVYLIKAGDEAELVKRVLEICSRPRSAYEVTNEDNSNIAAVVDLYEEVVGDRTR